MALTAYHLDDAENALKFTACHAKSNKTGDYLNDDLADLIQKLIGEEVGADVSHCRRQQ